MTRCGFMHWILKSISYPCTSSYINSMGKCVKYYINSMEKCAECDNLRYEKCEIIAEYPMKNVE